VAAVDPFQSGSLGDELDLGVARRDQALDVERVEGADDCEDELAIVRRCRSGLSHGVSLAP
jgi:hypothetical protein